MNPALGKHLNGEALDDVLIGAGSRAAHAHLEQCPSCRARVDEFRSTVSLFNQASAAWADARPLRPQPTPARPLYRRPLFATLAAAALLASFAGVQLWHHAASAPEPTPVIADNSQDTETQIANDNELLQAVNAAIAPNEQSMADQYGLIEHAGSQHPKRAE